MNAGTKHGYNRPHVVRQFEDWEYRMFPQDRAQTAAIVKAATLRECGKWLDTYGGLTPMTMLFEAIEQLKRGEAPWEVVP